MGRLPLTVLCVLMTLGAALRLYQLDTGLWYDEIVTVIVSVRPTLVEITTHFPGNNSHPLYSVCAHISVALFGESPWTVRLPSVLSGVAAIPAVYLVGTAVATRFEGLLAASILTVSYHHIWFSQNARGYTMLLLFVLLSTYFLLRWLSGGRSSNLVAYAVVSALGSYTHLTMVPIVVTHSAVCVLELFRRRASVSARGDWARALAAFSGAGVITILLYSPMLVDVQQFFTTETVASSEVATPLWALTAALQGLQIGFGALWGLGLGMVIFGAGVWSYFTENRAALYLFILPIPVTLALAVVAARPVFPRFVFFAIGFALLIVVRGGRTVGEWFAERMRGPLKPRLTGMVAAGLLTVAVVAASIRSLPYGYRYPKQDYAQAVAFIEASSTEGDQVAVVGDTAAIPVQKYLGKAWPRIDRAADLNELRTKGRETWVIFTFPAYIARYHPALWTMLNEECVEVAEFDGTVGGGAIRVARCSPVKM
ncbi:MAG: glycosyltransferase family 39 protein [Vicinamibacterales bacterium]